VEDKIKYSSFIDENLNKELQDLNKTLLDIQKTVDNIRKGAAVSVVKTGDGKELKEQVDIINQAKKAVIDLAEAESKAAAERKKLAQIQAGVNAEMAKVITKTRESVKEQASQIEGLNKNLDKLNNQISLNRKQLKELEKQGQSSSEEYQKLSLQTKLLNEEKKDLSKTLQHEININRSAKGTLSEVNAEVNKLKREIKFLDIGTEEYIETAAKIKGLENIQRDFNETVGRGRTFVGEYAKGFDVTTMNVLELKKAIKDLRNESFTGKSKEDVDALNRKIGELEDKMVDLRTEQNAYGMEFGAAIAGSLKFVAAGVEGVVGSMELLGMGEENAQKAQKSLMGLIAVTQALGEVEDALQKKTLQVTAAKIKDTIVTAKNTVVKWLNVGAGKAQAGATEQVTGATTKMAGAGKKGFDAFGILQGIMGKFKGKAGLVIAALAAIGMGIYVLVRSLQGGSKYMEAFAETLEDAMKNSAQDRMELEALTKTIGSAGKGTQGFKNGIDELNSKFKDAIGYTIQYTASQDELNLAYKRINETIIKRAQQEAIMSKIVELETQKIEKAAENSTYFGDALDYTTQKILSTSSSLRNVTEDQAMYKDMLESVTREQLLAMDGNGMFADSYNNLAESVNKATDAEKKRTGIYATNSAVQQAAIDAKKEDDQKAVDNAKKAADEELKAKEEAFKKENELAFLKAESQITAEEDERKRIDAKKVQTALDYEEAMNAEIEFTDNYDAELIRRDEEEVRLAEKRRLRHEEEIAMLNGLNDAFRDVFAQIGDILTTFQEIRLQNLDEEITAQDDAVKAAEDRLVKEEELAEAGLASDVTKAKKKLAIEKQQQAELLKERKKAAKNMQMLKKGELTIDYISEVGKLALNSTALGPISGQIWAAIQIALATGRYMAGIAQINAQKFAHGTENVNLNGAPDGIDTVPAYLTKGERVVDADTNKSLLKMGVKNKDLSDVVAKGMLLKDVLKGDSNALIMLSEMQKTNELIGMTNKILKNASHISDDGNLIILKDGTKIRLS